MSVKILHLSDIHFNCPKNNGFDIDEDLRSELENDLKQLVENFGKVDLILIGGDIAFSGTKEEYDKAHLWLKSVTEIIHCPDENVLAVPGNHDVNRASIKYMLADMQKGFKQLRVRTDLDERIRKLSEDKGTVDFMLLPLENYQNFVVKYGVSHAEGQPFYWQKDVKVGSYIMRIQGVNSAISSNAEDDDRISPLFLGSMQTVLKRQEGMFYLFLCHHPPDWLIDRDEVETDLNKRARIQLFGHKHKFKAEKLGDTLKLSAGAVHPSRKELNWDPRYNLLEIEASDGKVSVKVWKRVWDKDERKFRADYANRVDCETHIINLDEVERKIVNDTVEKSDEVEIIQQAMANGEDTEKVEIIDPQQPSPLRKLGYYFLSLSYADKILIAVDLRLLEEGDQYYTDVEKSKAYFERAKSKNLLHELWDKVAAKYPLDTLGSNPF